MYSSTNNIHHPGSEVHRFLLEQVRISELSELFIANNTVGAPYFGHRDYHLVVAQALRLHHGLFKATYAGNSALVSVLLAGDCLELLCDCREHQHDKLCKYQALALLAVCRRNEYLPFFDDAQRQSLFTDSAAGYGLEQAALLDDYFELLHSNGRTEVQAKRKDMVAVTPASLHALYDELALEPAVAEPAAESRTQRFVVLRQHKYYGYLGAELYEAPLGKGGKIKNPLRQLDPLACALQSEAIKATKFYAAVYKFQQQQTDNKQRPGDLEALRALLHIPDELVFYYHDDRISEQLTAASIQSAGIAPLTEGLSLDVADAGDAYTIEGTLLLNGERVSTGAVQIRFTYFIQYKDCLYLADSLKTLSLVRLLQRHGNTLRIQRSRYRLFHDRILARLEQYIAVHYHYIQPATEAQLTAAGFAQAAAPLLYLSDSGAHVLLTPAMRYGELEAPVRTKRQLYTQDEQCALFSVARDDEAEANFIALLIRQHPLLAEQLENDLDHFYLPKKQFLDEDWFLEVFDVWRSRNITILGFNQLEGNKLSPHKAQISIHIESGLNWFNAIVSARFGKNKATLKQLHKAIQHRSKYVVLDDGSLGIIPEDWIERFKAFFNAGDISETDTLHLPKVCFSTVEQLYAASEMDQAVQSELSHYRERTTDMGAIPAIPAPEGLEAILRPYQRFGLSWLAALDALGFGACLADDMGLGKSLQIIAFILHLRGKKPETPHLLVVPTTLISSWQREIEKFAPSLRVHLHYGPQRRQLKPGQYDLVLTSYGAMLSDIGHLQSCTFHYVFLDESQQIKNPDAQRYKAAQLLRSHGRVVITGTPVENNTFDLYAQLSFACPGLLGSKQYFRDIYAIPVDQFKISKRARELQELIRPFVLRRTKQQVAPELPEKTETILYCPMGPEQRRVYNAYEKEFREYISATSADEVKKNPMHALKGLTRLRQICDAPMLLPDDQLRCEAAAKMEVLLHELRNKAPRHKILVFSQFVSMLELIRKELEQTDIGFAWLTGASRNRQAAIDDFQQNEQTRVFLISLKAGGTGLNLTEADYVYLVDPWWNPAVENQAIDRAHRIGQDKKVIAVRLICPGTVEDKMLRMQEQKKSLAQDLISTGNSSMLSKEALLGLLNEDGLQADDSGDT